MDGDYPKQKKENKKAEDGDSLSDFGDLLQPSWVRCPICTSDEMDRFLLDYGRYFLCPFSIILWVLLLVISAIA
jgi:hypothetical protein